MTGESLAGSDLAVESLIGEMVSLLYCLEAGWDFLLVMMLSFCVLGGDPALVSLARVLGCWGFAIGFLSGCFSLTPEASDVIVFGI